MTFGFYTLGCKVNQYETQAMAQLLEQKGHCTAEFDRDCDGYIINTCSVTGTADKKNRAVIRRCRREHPDAVIGVCGCYPQHDPAAIEKLGADVIGGSAQREEFLDNMLRCAEDRKKRGAPDNALKRREFECLPPGGLGGRTRAMLKIQDGCVNFCSYCIIPYTRGPVRSAPVALAVAQARELSARGYRELVLTGIEIASWGADLPGKPGLGSLLTEVCRAVPEQRVRLGSLEPRLITPEFCQVLKSLPNLCPHFHLSLQSGCDTVLARMKRKYTCDRFYESVCLLRQTFPDCAVTTDLIVGFPGETEAEFEKTIAFIRKCGFADMHIFPYSRRPGTVAADLPGQIPNAVKEERSRRAIAVAEQMHLAFCSRLCGQTLQVLFEEPDGDCFVGHAPDYTRVYASGRDLHNVLAPVYVKEIFRDGVRGTIVK